MGAFSSSRLLRGCIAALPYRAVGVGLSAVGVVAWAAIPTFCAEVVGCPTEDVPMTVRDQLSPTTCHHEGECDKECDDEGFHLTLTTFPSFIST